MEPAYFNILLQSDYDSVINACKSNSIFFKICRQPYFWKQKALLDFRISSITFDSIELRDNKARYEFLLKANPGFCLIDASRDGNLELLKYFISIGAKNYGGALTVASKYGNIDIVQYLIPIIDNHPHIDAYDKPLVYAALNGYLDIVKILISHGAKDFNIAMTYAAKGGHLDVFKFLIPYARRGYYNIALGNAAEGGHRDIVELLLSLGANDYNTALNAAIRSGNMDVVRLIRSYM